jgi:hypothetical protein
MAAIVAVAEPSDGIDEALVTTVSAATGLVEGAAPTATVTVAVSAAIRAVTVMFRAVGSPPVESAACAPVAPVRACPVLNEPEDA